MVTGIDAREAASAEEIRVARIKGLHFKRQWAKGLLLALIVLYPLAGAFLGLDLGDTGYHLYAYENLTKFPDKINYTVYFSAVIGWAWGKLFGWLGLLGYNLLEVLLEWGVSLMTYRVLRKELGELTTLAGILFSVICADTYLNIFNYHQLNAFLLTAMLLLIYLSAVRKKWRYSFFAGAVYVLTVFSRVGSVVALIALILYFFSALMGEMSWRETGRQILAFLCGALALGLLLLLSLTLTGRLSLFINNLFRLGGIASDQESSYGLGNLLSRLIRWNLKSFANGILFYAAGGFLLCGLTILLQKCRTAGRRAVCAAVGLLALVIGGYQLWFSFKVNPAENWSQMTTGQVFFLGVFYVTVVACFVKNICWTGNDQGSSAAESPENGGHGYRLAFLCIAACLLLVLTVAGSNTGIKHVVLAMWLVAPLCFYTVRFSVQSGQLEAVGRKAMAACHLLWDGRAYRLTLLVLALAFAGKLTHLAYYSFNYDEVDRTKLTATVDSPKVRHIRTTQREADAINGVLEALSAEDPQGERPLMVFGNSLLFYYLTEREAYGKPWVTQSSYSAETFSQDLEALEEGSETLPVIIYCRTDYSKGFDEEGLSGYMWEISRNDYSGKKQILWDFLEENEYGYVYVNDYYAVVIPGLTTDMGGMRNIVYGT